MLVAVWLAVVDSSSSVIADTATANAAAMAAPATTAPAVNPPEADAAVPPVVPVADCAVATTFSICWKAD